MQQAEICHRVCGRGRVRLEGKVAVVTGAASGIGRATADLFAEEGATVYATDVDPRDGGGRIVPVRHDTSVEAEWEALLRRIEAEQGRLDILVNNAGIVGTYDTITTASMSDYHRVIAVNQTGFFLGMRFTIPLMQRGGKGSIINVSSILGLIGAVGVAPYQASRGAVYDAHQKCGADLCSGDPGQLGASRRDPDEDHREAAPAKDLPARKRIIRAP